MNQIPYTYLKYIMKAIEELKSKNFESLTEAKSYIYANGGYVFHEEENFIDFGYNNIEATFYKEGDNIVIHGLIEAFDDLGESVIEIVD